MKASEILERARAQGLKTLSEEDSRQVLAGYGVPLVQSRLARTPAEAREAARELGFPVVLKGTGARLPHKTEADVVRLGIRDQAELDAAYQDILAKGGERLEGMLVQRQVRSPREFVAGLSRDPQFGPCVMFGLGGIFTEVLQDVTFRVAPIERLDALEMLEEIKGAKLLGPFRGSPAVDRERLAALLVGLSRLGDELAEVAEVDINPILVDGDQPVAVDALVVLA